MIKIVSRSFFNTKVLDTFCFKKSIEFFKQSTRTDGSVLKSIVILVLVKYINGY